MTSEIRVWVNAENQYVVSVESGIDSQILYTYADHKDAWERAKKEANQRVMTARDEVKRKKYTPGN